MNIRRLIWRVVRSVLTIYAAVTVVGAMLLVQIALHPPRLAVDHAALRQIFASRAELAKSAKGGQTWGTVATIRYQDVSIRATDGAMLGGSYLQPPRDNGEAVIILHGLGDNRMGASGFAPLFLDREYRVLLPDARAHGESGGAFASYGVRERDDVRRWIDWLYAQSPPPRCVYLLGESMGAAIAIQATAADPRICAVAAESSFATFRQIAYVRVGQFTGSGPWFGRTLGRPMIELALLYAYLRYRVNLATASPEEALRRRHTPVLLIHGEADSNIPYSNSVELHQAAPEHTELWLVPHAEHSGASAVKPDEFNRRVLAWFAEHRAP